jgi:glycogen debranching enzyme
MTEGARNGSGDGEVEDRYQILATPALTLAGTRVLKHGDTFAVFDRYGDIRGTSVRCADGLYHEGTRFLSALRLRVDQNPLLLLSSTVLEDNVVLAVDLMNSDLQFNGEPAIQHAMLHVFRSKFLWQATYYERLLVTNHSRSAIRLALEIGFAADFADVFEVRGTPRERHGTMHPAEHTRSEVVLSYTGLDSERRRTRLRFTPAPDQCGSDRVLFRIALEPKQVTELFVEVACETAQCPERETFEWAAAQVEASRAVRRHEHRDTRIYTSNEQCNAWLTRSNADLQMLLTDNARGPYPYAGVPWFSTPFGRDGILTALSVLWINPEIARGVLGRLSVTQAEGHDDSADAEPGKIVHELRDGEMARLREVPFGRYYGSIDSTPLFVMLAAAYYETTGDVDFVQRIWPNVERALSWIDVHGDRDGDGFVEYGRRCADGLVHQGWKDSVDAIFHADGTLAEGPIALCEVQGYVYAAKLGAAKIADGLGMPLRSRELAMQAEALRSRFDSTFWCAELSSYALALDGAKRPCRVRSSNAGQCLFTGIVLPERAAELADQLLAPEMFSGWGVRTIASTELRHNPMGYHNGSVWPHDNALIAAGLAAYGHKDHAGRILTALFNASVFLDLNRLPELFCGFARRAGEGPTQYPVACAPQAWAAAAPFLILRAVLGLSIEGAARRVRFEYPSLPNFLNEVHIFNLRAGTSAVDLRLHRHPDDVGIHVCGRRRPVEVVSIQ